MPKYYKNKYLNGSKRLKNWDYRGKGVYFITINTKNNQPFFGEINQKGHLISTIGMIALQFWQRIPWYSKHVKLDHFIVMPNHVHGLLVIDKLFIEKTMLGSLQCNDPNITNQPKNERMSDISPKAGSVSAIIRSYKSAVTKEARKINPDFAWQNDFYDQIVTDINHLRNARLYIEKNPENWLKKRNK